MKICSRLRSLRFLLPLSLALFFACSDSGVPVPCTSCVISIPADIDNTMYEALADTNSNGRGAFVFSGNTTGLNFPPPQLRHALLRFDVAAAVPSGATITSVTMFLTMTQEPGPARGGVSDVKFRVHRVTKEWGEGSSLATPGGGGTAPRQNDATWVHSLFPDSLWANDGGDFVPAPSGSTIVSGVGTRQSWESGAVMAADVQGWLDDASSNFGWILIGDESVSGTVKQFASQQNPSTQLRPSLQISYTAP